MYKQLHNGLHNDLHTGLHNNLHNGQHGNLHDELEKRLDALAEQNWILRDNCLVLETSYTELKCEIENLKEKVQSNATAFGEVYLLFQELNSQN